MNRSTLLHDVRPRLRPPLADGSPHARHPRALEGSPGSIGLLWPNTDAAFGWVDEHLYCDANENPLSWFGGAIIVEHRFVCDILDAVTRDGLTVSAL
jgi:hypothetical protein